MTNRTNDIPLSEAISRMLKSYQLSDKVQMADLVNNWEKLFGKTMAKYSRPIFLNNGDLKIKVDQAPLRSQIHYNEAKVIDIINEYFKAIVVKKIILI
ncbi:MAG: hypothetical protein RL708_740 [Bacteroidota bacterium]|jgi:hypothetical protein